jgi:hypothetical protein
VLTVRNGVAKARRAQEVLALELPGSKASDVGTPGSQSGTRAIGRELKLELNLIGFDGVTANRALGATALPSPHPFGAPAGQLPGLDRRTGFLP